MVWAVTARGQDTATSGSDNLVIPSFTPGANSLLIVALNHTDDAGSLSLSGHDDGMAWAQIFKSDGFTGEFELWACITGSSPSAGTITVTKGYGWTYAAACVEITGDFDTAPTAMTDLFGTYQAVEQYTTSGDNTLDVTLSAFASANNMTLVLARDEALIFDDFSFTEVQVSAGANLNDISVLWYDGEDTNPEIQFNSWITAGLAAVEIKEAAGGGTTTEQIPVGQIAFTGQAPSANIIGNQSFGVPIGRLTFSATAPSAVFSGIISIGIPAGRFNFIGNAPSFYPRTTDTVVVSGPVTDSTSIFYQYTGAAPANGDIIQWDVESSEGYTVTVAADGTFMVSGGSGSQTFWARVYDTSDGTWGSWQQITVVIVIEEQVPASIVRLTGLAPSVSIIGNQSFEIPVGNINFIAHAPRIGLTARIIQAIPRGLVQFRAIAPSVSIQGNQSAEVPANVLQFRGAAPRVTIFDPTAPIAARKPTAGGGAKTHKGRAVIIGNRRYVVYSYTEERYLLSKHLESLHRKQVRAQAVKTETYRKKRIRLLATEIETAETRLAEVEREWRREEDDLLLLILAA